MRYLSPIFFFGDNFQVPLDTRMIQREMKKLLAELELADGDTIVRRGRSFMRNELIDYFGELQQEKIVAWHLAIVADPVLLRFLQDATINEGDRFKPAPTYDDLDFIAWIAPYFGASFAMLAATAFERADASGLRALLANRLLISPEAQEKCWVFISDILEKNIALFDHYRDRTQKGSASMMPVSAISAYLLHGYFEVIRELPDPRFSRLKDRYAFGILYPVVAVFNRNKRKRALAMTWVEEASKLAVSENVRGTIRAKMIELMGILHQAEKTAHGRNITIFIFVAASLMWYTGRNVIFAPLVIPGLSPKPARSVVKPDSTTDTLRSDSVRYR